MCGIGGWIGDGPVRLGEPDLAAMMATMCHRGPDDWFGAVGRVALGHKQAQHHRSEQCWPATDGQRGQ